jgi:hypothetical protein
MKTLKLVSSTKPSWSKFYALSCGKYLLPLSRSYIILSVPLFSCSAQLLKDGFTENLILKLL